MLHGVHGCFMSTTNKWTIFIDEKTGKHDTIHNCRVIDASIVIVIHARIKTLMIEYCEALVTIMKKDMDNTLKKKKNNIQFVKKLLRCFVIRVNILKAGKFK